MIYRLLGFTVWKGAKWYLGRRYGRLVPSRRVVAAGLVVALVAGLAAEGSRRSSGAPAGG